MMFVALEEDEGMRLDVVVQARLPNYSRSRIQEWIKAGRILVDGVPRKASFAVRGGLSVDVSPAPATPLRATAEDIDLKILYEDDDLVAIDKASGMVVHAGAGVHSGTVVNALLHRFRNLSQVGGDLRPGIVHRLDRFTSGVLLVAKNDLAHRKLAEQFAAREVRKIYLTMVHGSLAQDRGRIEKPIARDPKRRERMTARLTSGRAAWSEYTVLERHPKFTYLEMLIGTGRTHQIRVHLSSIGHVVVGDKLYGAPESELGRYFLHAHRIEFRQPSTGELVVVESPLTLDLQQFRLDPR